MSVCPGHEPILWEVVDEEGPGVLRFGLRGVGADDLQVHACPQTDQSIAGSPARVRPTRNGLRAEAFGQLLH